MEKSQARLVQQQQRQLQSEHQRVGGSGSPVMLVPRVHFVVEVFRSPQPDTTHAFECIYVKQNVKGS